MPTIIKTENVQFVERLIRIIRNLSVLETILLKIIPLKIILYPNRKIL